MFLNVFSKLSVYKENQTKKNLGKIRKKFIDIYIKVIPERKVFI